jgi:hypothetical protein
MAFRRNVYRSTKNFSASYTVVYEEMLDLGQKWNGWTFKVRVHYIHDDAANFEPQEKWKYGVRMFYSPRGKERQQRDVQHCAYPREDMAWFMTMRWIRALIRRDEQFIRDNGMPFAIQALTPTGLTAPDRLI